LTAGVALDSANACPLERGQAAKAQSIVVFLSEWQLSHLLLLKPGRPEPAQLLSLCDAGRIKSGCRLL